MSKRSVTIGFKVILRLKLGVLYFQSAISFTSVELTPREGRLNCLNCRGHQFINNNNNIILLHEKFLQFDWLQAVVFQLNLKYLLVKITKHLWLVV